MTGLPLLSSLVVALLLATFIPHTTSFTLLPSPMRAQSHLSLSSSSSSSSSSSENPNATEKPILCDLQTFLRLLNLDEVPTGGAAKWLIQDGQVLLNGKVETRRAKKLYAGDKVQLRDDDTMMEVAAQVALRGYVYKPKKRKPDTTTTNNNNNNNNNNNKYKNKDKKEVGLTRASGLEWKKEWDQLSRERDRKDGTKNK